MTKVEREKVGSEKHEVKSLKEKEKTKKNSKARCGMKEQRFRGGKGLIRGKKQGGKGECGRGSKKNITGTPRKINYNLMKAGKLHGAKKQKKEKGRQRASSWQQNQLSRPKL